MITRKMLGLLVWLPACLAFSGRGMVGQAPARLAETQVVNVGVGYSAPPATNPRTTTRTHKVVDRSLRKSGSTARGRSSQSSSRAGKRTSSPSLGNAAVAAMMKDDKVARLVAYYRANKKWPPMTYKDPDTGAALGSFLVRVIQRDVSLSQSQRAALQQVDPDLFGGAGSNTGAAPAIKAVKKNMIGPAVAASVAAPAATKKGSKDEVIGQLLTYYAKHGKWPSLSYKDPETGVHLGRFLHHAIERNVKLTETQRALLLAADGEVFGVRRGHGAARAMKAVRQSMGDRGVGAKDEAVAKLVEYHNKHRQWPSLSYQDQETGMALGKFLHHVVERDVSLSQSQREALLAVDGNLFTMRRGRALRSPEVRKMAAAVSKDDAVAKLVAYYKKHKSWPSLSYKDPDTGMALGRLLHRVIERDISMSEAQRASLLAVDKTVFDVRRGQDAARRMKAIRRNVGGAARAKDDVIARLVAYHNKHGEWPSLSYKDADTGVALGKFLHHAIERDVSLTETQKAALVAVDSDVFNVRRARVVVGGQAVYKSFGQRERERESTRAAIRGLIIERALNRLQAYYSQHQKWPSISYKDPETGAMLGQFLDKVVKVQVELTESQRQVLLALDPALFDVRPARRWGPFGAIAHTVSRAIAAVKGTIVMAVDVLRGGNKRVVAPTEVSSPVEEDLVGEASPRMTFAQRERAREKAERESRRATILAMKATSVRDRPTATPTTITAPTAPSPTAATAAKVTWGQRERMREKAAREARMSAARNMSSLSVSQPVAAKKGFPIKFAFPKLFWSRRSQEKEEEEVTSVLASSQMREASAPAATKMSWGQRERLREQASLEARRVKSLKVVKPRKVEAKKGRRLSLKLRLPRLPWHRKRVEVESQASTNVAAMTEQPLPSPSIQTLTSMAPSKVPVRAAPQMSFAQRERMREKEERMARMAMASKAATEAPPKPVATSKESPKSFFQFALPKFPWSTGTQKEEAVVVQPSRPTDMSTKAAMAPTSATTTSTSAPTTPATITASTSESQMTWAQRERLREKEAREARFAVAQVKSKTTALSKVEPKDVLLGPLLQAAQLCLSTALKPAQLVWWCCTMTAQAVKRACAGAVDCVMGFFSSGTQAVNETGVGSTLWAVTLLGGLVVALVDVVPDVMPLVALIAVLTYMKMEEGKRLAPVMA